MLREAAPLALLGWLVPGRLLGLGLGWFTAVAWNPVEARVELAGRSLLLIAAYVAVRVGAGALLAVAAPDAAYAGDIAALVGAGLVFGRTVGLAGRIARALAARPSALP